MRDYYRTLDVEKGADAKAIKSAYRRLATEWHPDKHQTATLEEQKQAEEKFKEISEAYSVLSDPEKKRNYDATGDPRGGFSGFHTTGDPFNFMRGFGFHRQSSRQPPPMRGQSIQYILQLTLTEALFGTEKSVEFDVTSPCPTCDAEGATEFDVCFVCGGNGMTIHRQENMVMQTTCRDCKGRGKRVKTPCNFCDARGTVSEHKSFEVQIPQGVQNGATLRIQGVGGQGLNGGPPGDLMIGLEIEMPDVSLLNNDERKQLEQLLSK